MTELEFWAALVQDYRQTVQRLPTLTSNKIRAGVPPPLRGVVWPSIAGAQDIQLHQDFERLCNETSPYDGLIGKDVGRSFPNVEMFREKDGEGQQMLRRVLRAFSLYDDRIGYCQGLGFVVGPLLMHMSEAESFSVLVRLMDHYDLRSCYTPDLAGLHMRIYQFQILLTRHLPDLSAHLGTLNVEPLYVSQWFLSFFAVTCPLPMLLRIYDIILAEGATETLMRVALSLMQRNQKKLLAFSEFEDVMQFLLSRSLWDTYAQQADEMVSDFVSLTNLVSRETLQTLEADFKQSQVIVAPSPLKTAAASLLGRFWGGASHQPSKSALSLKIPDVATVLTIRKTSSGNSLTSTMTSLETTVSDASTAPTEMSDHDRAKSEVISLASSDTPPHSMTNSTDRDLHNQIEDLLTALGKLQSQQNELARELQREKEEREEERKLANALLQRVRRQREKDTLSEDDQPQDEEDVKTLIERATQQFAPTESKRISIIQTKHQLRDAAEEYKQKHYMEAAKCRHLMQRLDERESEYNALKEELKEARQRIQDSHKEKQRLERQAQEQKSRSSPVPDSPADLYTPITEKGDFDFRLPAPAKGLREFRLGKAEQRSSSLPFSKRTSSLLTQSVIAAPTPSPPPEPTQSSEALLLELVNAKTAEAVARQELEETKGKLDALRKIISGGASSPGPRAVDVPTITTPPPPSKTPEPAKPAHAASSSMGGFFSGWGKRST